MFTEKELNTVDSGYFNVISKGAFAVTLQSRNTKHCWHIMLQEYGSARSCIIYHTHIQGTGYHIHDHAGSLSSALNKIQKHDKYQIRFRNKRRLKHKKSPAVINTF